MLDVVMDADVRKIEYIKYGCGCGSCIHFNTQHSKKNWLPVSGYKTYLQFPVYSSHSENHLFETITTIMIFISMKKSLPRAKI